MEEEDSVNKTVIRKEKTRTEISEKLDSLRVFEKNSFLFQNLNFNYLSVFPSDAEATANETTSQKQHVKTNFTLRFGLFKSINKNEDNRKLNENSHLVGNANLKIEKVLIDKLSKGMNVDLNLSFMSIEHYEFEIAKIFFTLRIKIRNILQVEKLSFESIRGFLYDSLEKNKDLIMKVCLFN